MELSGGSPYSAQAQAKEALHKMLGKVMFSPTHMDLSMPTPLVLVHILSQMKSLRSPGLAKWLNQICC